MVVRVPINAGTSPTPKTATIIACLRPCRSAYGPKTPEPIGRISSVTANEAYTAASDNVGTSDGKNTWLSVGATYRMMNRSNRSNDQPSTEAAAAATTCWRGTAATSGWGGA